jgi:hypothetical protein
MGVTTFSCATLYSADTLAHRTNTVLICMQASNVVITLSIQTPDYETKVY